MMTTTLKNLRKRILGLGLTLGASLVVAGCGAGLEGGEIDPFTGEELTAEAVSLDIHNLMSDADMTGGTWVTEAKVQAFLNKKGGLLKNYRDPAAGNRTAADLIVTNARAQNINPIYILARIQTESSLISTGSASNIPKATGCGCPDGSGCSAMYQGFGKQIECSAKFMRNYLNDLATKGVTIAGWKVGVSKNTLDPCSVKPANKATAALYTYTPWVGAYGKQCGKTSVGGSTLLASIYTSYKADATLAP